MQRQEAYRCDVTYGTNNELGFDYLRDNMKFRLEEMVHRPFHYAIVDEVDSILIDEARTPLIISGPTEDNSELYIQVDKLIPALEPERLREGRKAEDRHPDRNRVRRRWRSCCGQHGLLHAGGLYDIHNVSLVHHVNQALRAHKLFARDTDYIVKDDKIIIIDEFTGRMMEGRRYSEGLHQALEAKEGVTVQNENQTLASITFQNYFRMYPKLAGMTGTAMTEAEEFSDIYKLEVIEVPTNEPVCRDDTDDEVYRSTREKFDAIVEQIIECRERKQPVLCRHGQHREIRGAVGAAQEAQDPAQRAERPLSRAGGLHHRAGRPPRRRDDRHQHGRPRHRHPARRQSRHAPQGRARADRGPGRARARAPPRSAPRSRRRARSCARPAGCS